MRTAFPAFVASAPTPVRSALPDPINASPAACSFTNLKTGPTKAKNSLASQLPSWSPRYGSAAHAPLDSRAQSGLSRVRSRVSRAYPGYGFGPWRPLRPRTHHDGPLLAKPWHCDARAAGSQENCFRLAGPRASNLWRLGSPGRGRKRTPRTRLAAARGRTAQRPVDLTRRCRARIGAFATQTRQPRPGRPSQVHDPRSPPAAIARLSARRPLRYRRQGMTLNHRYDFCENGGRAMGPKPWGEAGFSPLTILSCIIHTWRLMI